MEKIIQIINEADKVAVLPHDFADGDAIGSCLAMREALRGMGKQAEIYAGEELEARLRFLDDGIIIYSGESVPCDTCVVLDCGDEERMGERRAIAEGAKRVVNIDHHGTNTFFGDAAYVEPEAAATGEILVKLFDLMGVVITGGIAKYLYAAICSDTGCFAYSNASPDTFRTAARLVESGIDHADIARELFDCAELGTELFKAELTGGIHSYYGGRLRTVAAEDALAQKYGVPPREMTDLVNIPRRIRGTLAAASFKLANGKIRVSLRANTDIDVAAVALKFGGGGHMRAAGCTMEGITLDEAERLVVDAFGEVFDERDSSDR